MQELELDAGLAQHDSLAQAHHLHGPCIRQLSLRLA